MSNDAFGNLGSELKTMKDGRASLRAEIKDNRNRLRVETGQTLAAASEFLSDTGKANDRMAAQTHQMLAQADKDLKVQAKQTLAEANSLLAAIRKDVVALKADAGRILAGASGFLTQTGADNAKLFGQTRKMLAHARAESKAQTRQSLAEAGKVITQTKASVAGLKMDTGRLLADAAGVMKQLSATSRQRSAAWRGILGLLHGRASQPASHIAAEAAATGKGSRKATARRSSKGHGRKVA